MTAHPSASRAPSTRLGCTRPTGFTLVELLVVIAIVGLLVGLLLPAVQTAREAGRRVNCQSNLRQLGLAASSYHDTHQHFPAGFTQDRIRGSYQGHSVFYFLLPYLEETSLFNSMDREQPRNNVSATPGERAAAAIPTLLCSSDVFPEGNPHPYSSTQWYGSTSYRANGGSRPIYATTATNDGMFMATGTAARRAPSAPAGIEVTMSSVDDGLSQTILFAEGSHVDPLFDTFAAAGWTSKSTLSTWSRWYPAGGDAGLGNLMCGAFAPLNYTIPFSHGDPAAPSSRRRWHVFQDQRLSAIGSEHPAGANAAFVDGSVRFLNESMPQAVLALACVRDDGEILQDAALR